MWRELTEDDVLAALNERELSAYKIAAISIGQDVLAQIIQQVTDECRGRIGDCSQNRLAEGMTLPERTHYHAVALIRFRLITRLDLDVSDDRRTEQKDALAFFRDVAACKVALEQPGGLDTASITQPSPGIRGRRREFSRRQQNGI